MFSRQGARARPRTRASSSASLDVPANATLDQTDALRRSRSTAPSDRCPSSTTASSSRSPTGGFGGMVVKPWDERTRSIFQIHAGGAGQARRRSRACGAGVPRRRRCPARGTSRSSSCIASTATTKSSCAFAQQLVAGGDEERACSPSRRSSTEVRPGRRRRSSFDRDKVASLGLNLQQVGADLAAALGGNYVNWFNIAGAATR